MEVMINLGLLRSAVLVLLAILLGTIWSMMQWPAWWRKTFSKMELKKISKKQKKLGEYVK